MRSTISLWYEVAKATGNASNVRLVRYAALGDGLARRAETRS